MIPALLWALGAATTLSVCGSETLGRTATAWAREWGEREPEIDVETRFPGSGTSLSSLADGSCRAALLSGALSGPRNLPMRQVGWDEVVFFVHPRSPLRSISLARLRLLLADERTRGGWRIYGRNELSGTHAWVRDRILSGAAFASGTRLLAGPQGVVRAVASDPHGIGYASRDALHGEVQVLRLLDHTGTAVRLLRPLFLARRPEDGLAKRFEEFTLSLRGQALLSQNGLLPLAAIPSVGHP